MAELETERLILRAFKDSDAAPFAQMNADPVVMEHFPATLTRAESDALIGRIMESIDAHGYGFWAAEEKASGAFIGFIGIKDVTFEAPFIPAVEIGWRLARPFWGKGYASEGARASLNYGFDVLGLGEIVSFTTTENYRSQSVMQRIGMTRDEAGDFLHPAFSQDYPMALHVLYRISAIDHGHVRG